MVMPLVEVNEESTQKDEKYCDGSISTCRWRPPDFVRREILKNFSIDVHYLNNKIILLTLGDIAQLVINPQWRKFETHRSRFETVGI
jgi:hypothetical protein